jgi:hypothetical protein
MSQARRDRCPLQKSRNHLRKQERFAFYDLTQPLPHQVDDLHRLWHSHDHLFHHRGVRGWQLTKIGGQVEHLAAVSENASRYLEFSKLAEVMGRLSTCGSRRWAMRAQSRIPPTRRRWPPSWLTTAANVTTLRSAAHPQQRCFRQDWRDGPEIRHAGHD